MKRRELDDHPVEVVETNFLGTVNLAESCLRQVSHFKHFESEIVWNTIPKRPLDIAVLVGDYSKAKRILGWEPKFTLEEGLRNNLSEGS